MSNASEKRSKCVARAAELRRRANTADDPASKADLRDLERHWLDVAESYKAAEEAGFHLQGLRARGAAPNEACATKPNDLGAPATSMLHAMAEQLRRCGDVQATLDWLLGSCLELTCAEFGNVQIMDWKAGHLEIKAQRGFHDEFLSFFNRVKYRDGSACARALLHRDPIVVEDVVLDREFVPCLKVVQRAGVRAVQSTPLVSSSGALVGIVSTHFPTPYRPTDIQMQRTREAAQLAANAIVLHRSRTHGISTGGPN
ncbi:MAG TPA: GAF domain-containing protein [Xanthobacteraceae bacterium]|nr:GAF domain-containing protein [Xanthobacteraceae bacterium]